MSAYRKFMDGYVVGKSGKIGRAIVYDNFKSGVKEAWQYAKDPKKMIQFLAGGSIAANTGLAIAQESASRFSNPSNPVAESVLQIRDFVRKNHTGMYMSGPSPSFQDTVFVYKSGGKEIEAARNYTAIIEKNGNMRFFYDLGNDGTVDNIISIKGTVEPAEETLLRMEGKRDNRDGAFLSSNLSFNKLRQMEGNTPFNTRQVVVLNPSKETMEIYDFGENESFTGGFDHYSQFQEVFNSRVEGVKRIVGITE
ncbi:MAG: hypothetical protein JW716_03765 [Candidatus Aenigmarchaeota archaeon]|nr:hypothetical protein [Candidatus Aenigmarchaeota archaeon]